MIKKAILIIGLPFLVSCASDVPSVKTLAQQKKANPHHFKSSGHYVIGPGDILAIEVWKEPDLSKQVLVRLDGNISLPLLDDVRAAGLSCKQLRFYLETHYREYVELAEVFVTVIESRSKKIYLLGKVNTPGEYLLQKDMTVVQAISLAGGLAEWADEGDIKLIRKINGVAQTYRVDYDAIVSGEDPSQNVQLQPDDMIFVP